MTDRVERATFHDSMVAKVEQARKSIDLFKPGRGRQAGLAKALDAVLEEIQERMDAAWRVLREPTPIELSPREHTFRSQKAAELGMCYVAGTRVYDELAAVSVIRRVDRTELTTAELARKLDQEEKIRLPRPPRVRVR